MPMIQINLLPGHESGAAAPAGPAAWARAARARLGAVAADRPLLFGAGAAVLAAAAVGALHTRQQAAQAVAAEREAAAVADSTRFAALLAARRSAVAERDSVRRQLAVIAEIDSSRYAWAHVLDEVSRAMPAYTWLTAVQQTSAPPTPGQPAGADSAGPKAAAGDTARGRTASDSAAARARGALAFRIVGQTVDIQALTAFMRELEGSPFVERVQLQSSQPAQVDGKEVTEFTLDARIERAPRALLRTERLAVAVAPAREPRAPGPAR
jgi:Tfp pilus assembly protein PilN